MSASLSIDGKANTYGSTNKGVGEIWRANFNSNKFNYDVTRVRVQNIQGPAYFMIGKA
jgi:hypothetical protein